MNKKLTIFAVFLVVLFVSISGASAYTNDSSAFYCYNCSDCRDALINNTYATVYLNESVTNNGTCMEAHSDFSNKTFDCTDHRLEGNGSGIGIDVDDSRDNLTNFTVKNCVITNFDYGIHVNEINNTIQNCNLSSNTYRGILLNISANNSYLVGNNVNSNVWGIYLLNCSNNTLINNTANSQNRGIYLNWASNTTLINNTAESNRLEYGIVLEDSSDNTLINNTAISNGMGIALVKSSPGSSSPPKRNNLTNNIANSNIHDGYYIKDSPDNNLINNGASFNSVAGIYIYNSDNSTVSNCTCNSNAYGIRVRTSSHSNISKNMLSANAYIGLSVEQSSNSNKLKNNTITLSGRYGLLLSESNHSLFSNNTVNFNYKEGIRLRWSANNNSLINNTLNSNTFGANISSVSNNTFSQNTVNSNQKYGIYIDSSNNIGLSKNTFNFNQKKDIYLSNTNNTTATNNSVYENNATIFLNENTNSSATQNQLKTFNISVHLVNSTLQTYSLNSIQLNPYNETLNYTNTSNYILGNFTPNETGIWSLSLNLTDSQNNNVTHSFKFMVNGTVEKIYPTTVKYYLRPYVEPTEGQPADTRSRALLLSKPNATETFTNTTWLQASPDQPLEFSNGTINNITIYHFYNASAAGYLGIQRTVTGDQVMDYQRATNNTSAYTYSKVTFTNLNWSMSKDSDWYNLAVKLNGTNVSWKSSPTNLSYLVINYTSKDPAVATSAPENTKILSTTVNQDDRKTANIQIDGFGTRTFDFYMPLSKDSRGYTINYDVSLDGAACTGAACSYTVSDGRVVSVTASLGGTGPTGIIRKFRITGTPQIPAPSPGGTTIPAAVAAGPSVRRFDFKKQPRQTATIIKGDLMEFEFKNETHSIRVNEISPAVKITISSSPTTLSLSQMNVPKYVSIDGDSIVDLSVTLKGKDTPSTAEIIFELLERAEPKPLFQSEEQKQEPSPEVAPALTVAEQVTEETTSKLSLWFALAVFGMLGMLAGFSIYHYHQKKSSYSYN